MTNGATRPVPALSGARSRVPGSPLPPGREWRCTRSALYLQTGLDYDRWAFVGFKIRVVADSAAWWIGDWLIFGRESYGPRYRAAIAASGFDYQTLRNYAWVASRFPVTRRRDALSFGHHAEVASLEPYEQERWLERCVVEGWPRAELRRRLRASRRRCTEGAALIPISLRVDHERNQRWRTAADAAGTPLERWIELALDLAAEAVLTPVASPARPRVVA